MSSPVVDPALARRGRSLAYTKPLHRLVERKALIADGVLAGYEPVSLAFIAVDLIALGMTFDRGADRLTVVGQLAAAAAAQQPQGAPSLHQQVAEWVVNELIGTARGHTFESEYGDFGAGGYVQRVSTYQLIKLDVADDGLTYLRATEEALSILVGALDISVEDAQFASEALLGRLIERGDLTAAEESARNARRLSKRYMEKLRQKLQNSQRRLDSVDWEQEMPTLITDALAHVDDRIKGGLYLQKSLRERHDSLEDPLQLSACARVMDEMTACDAQHSELQRRLMEARPLFLDEQRRQQLSAVSQLHLVDLERELLLPVLTGTLADARQPAADWVRGISGPGRTNGTMRLSQLILDVLLAAPRLSDPFGDPLEEEEELIPIQRPQAFDDQTFDLVEGLLARVTLGADPIRLSALLAQVGEHDRDGCRLLAITAQRAFHPTEQGAGGCLVAYTDGQRLPAGWPLGGDDLLLVRLPLQLDLPASRRAAGGHDADALEVAG